MTEIGTEGMSLGMFEKMFWLWTYVSKIYWNYFYRNKSHWNWLTSFRSFYPHSQCSQCFFEKAGKAPGKYIKHYNKFLVIRDSNAAVSEPYHNSLMNKISKKMLEKVLPLKKALNSSWCFQFYNKQSSKVSNHNNNF